MNRRIRILAILIMLAMVISVAACTSSETTSPGGTTADSESTAPAEPTDDTEKVNLIFAVMASDEKATELRQQYIDDPMIEAFSNLDITVTTFTDRQSLQVQVAGGSGPDIFDLDGPTDAAEFAKAERLVDLSDYADQFGWEALFYDWAWGTSFYDGKLYSLPNSFEGMVIYYNVDVFNEMGWEYPNNVDEMIVIMDEAMDAGIMPLSFGNSDYQGAVDWLYSTFLSCYAGPDALKEALEGDRSWNDPLIYDSMDMLVSWWQKGYIGNKSTQAISMDDLMTLFADGDAAMMINGTWAATGLINTYPETEWELDIVPELRSGVGRVLPLATGGCFVINANSAVPDQAAEVLDWLFRSTDRHLESVKEANFQPYPVTSFDIDLLEGMDDRMIDMYDDLMTAQADGNIGYCSWTFFPSDSRVYMNENTDGLFLDLLEIETYLSEVEKYVDNAIETGTAPILP